MLFVVLFLDHDRYIHLEFAVCVAHRPLSVQFILILSMIILSFPFVFIMPLLPAICHVLYNVIFQLPTSAVQLPLNHIALDVRWAPEART